MINQFWTEAKISPRGKVNYADLVAWGNNALWFFAPTLVILLPSIVGVIPVDWKYAAITMYILNRLTDLIKRFYTGKEK